MNKLISRWQRWALRGTEGGERHRGQRSWSNICASRSWSSDMSGTPCWEFKVHGEILGQQADLEHVIRQREGNTNCRGFGMRCECWAISGMRQSTPTFNVQCVQSNLSGLCAFAGKNGSFKKNGLFPLKACQNRLAHRLLAMTRRTWDSEPKQVTNHEQKKCTERLE